MLLCIKQGGLLNLVNDTNIERMVRVYLQPPQEGLIRIAKLVLEVYIGVNETISINDPQFRALDPDLDYSWIIEVDDPIPNAPNRYFQLTVPLLSNTNISTIIANGRLRGN